MKLLLTNDDGFDAPGIHALLKAIEGLGQCVVIAPNQSMSGCSHQVTTHAPIQVECRGASSYSISGTPADCVRIGLHQLAPDASFVLSGINEGGNLGADVFYSGTVAAVREGVLNGLPGFSISQYSKKDQPIDWIRAARWTQMLLKRLMQTSWTVGTFWNINLPHLSSDQPDPQTVFCPLDFSHSP